MKSINELQIFENAINNNKLAHAYLLYAQKGIDLEPHILDIIKLLFKKMLKIDLNVNHIDQINYIDFKVVRPNQDGLITKESINLVVNTFYESALSSQAMKILYVKDVDLGNKFSLNALLKFVEEPVKNLIILFSTNHFDQVISTITSRTQNIYVKSQNLATKIAIIEQFLKTDKLALIAHIYQNPEDAKTIDLKLFEKTYQQILEILKLSIKDPYYIKAALSTIWTKENSDLILNILQFFYYQVQININHQWPLFPQAEQLINSYKIVLINYNQIIQMISDFHYAIKHYANFNLQKINFLNQLETLYIAAKN